MMTYISNMVHFLDDDGNIASDMSKEGKELASFLLLVIDTYNHNFTDDKQQLRCFTENCKGIITTNRSILTDEIIWNCPVCGNDGRISGWRCHQRSNTIKTQSKTDSDKKEIIAWVQKLKTELVFPVNVKPTNIIRDDFPNKRGYKITQIVDYLEIYGIIVEVTEGETSYSIPICDLYLIEEDSDNYNLIEEYLSWWFLTNEDF